MASLETPPGAEPPPPPPPPPPVYSWQPDQPDSPWLPDHPAGPPQPQLHSPTAPRQRRGAGGAAGGIVAALIAFFKYGLVALKFAKIGPTAISMIIAFGIYTLFFGPWFAVGVVLLILVHEMGHVLFSWIEGVPMSLPVFLGPFGAVTQLRGPLRDAKQEAIIALGGPLVGTVAAILVYLYATTLQPGHTQAFFFALAYFGCFINLFNLVPMSPLDGGRIANAISRWMNVVGLAIMLGFFLLFGNIFALILFIIGLFTTISRFRNAARGLEPQSVPPATRAVIGLVWLGMLVLAAGGLTVTHNAIVNGGVVHGVDQTSQNF